MRWNILTWCGILLMNVVPVISAPSAKERTRAAQEVQAGFDRDIQPLLEKYCYSCHGNGKHKGDLALDRYRVVENILADVKPWLSVLRNIHSGEMPPEDKPQPSASERELLVQWIENTAFSGACENPDPGRVTIRRLNRAEYNNTIRDLVAVDFKPAADFPQDDVGYGFDNIGDVLSIPPILLEKYLAAADKIMETAIVSGGPKLGGPTQRFEGEKMEREGDLSAIYPVGDVAMGLYREGEIFTSVNLNKAGDYAVRIRAWGQQAGKDLPQMELRVDGTKQKVFNVRASERRPEVFEFTIRLEVGSHRIGTAYLNNFNDPNDPVPSRRDRNLFVDYVELVGPLEPQPYPESHTRIFFAGPPEKNPEVYAKEIIRRFITRAWRRPVTTDETSRLTVLFTHAQQNGDSFEDSIKLALEAALVSPHFLFRGEVQPDPDNAKSVHQINEFALASRLSYFLWSTMPDEELLQLAGKKTLRKNLNSQIKRMMQDHRSEALVQNFAAQWLQIRSLSNVAPAKQTYPSFDEELREAMGKETEMFFTNIMREDRSLLDFLEANYTFVNERLARHYGITGITGKEFQKVSFTDGRRGGLLTHASILTLTSNPTRTSPVKRGKWILENILGTPPPPPPPDVPELSEEKEKILSGSLRQRMEQHRQTPICASCHARMDPIGFGFENFDGIGAWREMDGKFPVEADGKLVSGQSFEGPSELKKILMEQKRTEFLRCVTEKMLTFALGRGLEYYDKCAVDKIVKALEKDQFRFSTLVNTIVGSLPFQMRRGDSTPLTTADAR